MKLSDYPDFIAWQQKLDELCEVYLEWHSLKYHMYSHHSSTLDSHYIGYLIRKGHIRILCYHYYNPTQSNDIKYTPRPDFIDVPLNTFDDDDFQEQIDKYTKRIESMKLREFLNESLPKILDDIIINGKSDLWRGNSSLHNYYYHFTLGNNVYDVYGFNNGNSAVVNFQTNGDENFVKVDSGTDQRKVFGGIIQCVAKLHVRELEFKAKGDDKSEHLRKFYDSKMFKVNVERETGCKLVDYEVSQFFHQWTYRK